MANQIPWREMVNFRVREGVEALTFVYSKKGGKVSVFDEAGGEIKGIPIRSWSTLAEVDPGQESERGSIAPSLIPRREGDKCALHPNAPPLEMPEVPGAVTGGRKTA